jgi:hypothetical protein
MGEQDMTYTFRLPGRQWAGVKVAAGVVGEPVSVWVRRAVQNELLRFERQQVAEAEREAAQVRQEQRMENMRRNAK